MEARSSLFISNSDSHNRNGPTDLECTAVTDYAELGFHEAQTNGSSEHEKLKVSPESLSTLISLVVIAQLAGISFITSFSNGIIAVGLPTIAEALDIRSSVLLWPSSIGFLTTGTFLLLGGALADVAGPKLINLLGCVFLTASTLAIGLSQSGLQLIVCRALQGVAFALAYPSSVSVISVHLKRGSVRNVGFACLGFSMVLGFMCGLFVGAVEWRIGFYIAGASGLMLCIVGAWSLPHDSKTLPELPTWRSIGREIDWIGAGIACSLLALISTFLALVAADATSIKGPLNICLLVISVMLMRAFGFWMHWQEKHKRPALIPNSIWTTNGAFTCICIMMMIAGAVQNCMEILCSLFFQEVQGVSPIGTALRILPTSIMGCVLNLVTGRLIHHARPIYPALITTVVCTASPLIMALIDPSWPYWYAGFWGVLLSALTGDVIYTIGLLISADAFPARMQGLAGAVFNVFYMLGSSIGLTIVDVILSTVDGSGDDGHNTRTQMPGLRASFWTLFAMTVASAILGGIGLRRLGRIGLSHDTTEKDAIPRRVSH